MIQAHPPLDLPAFPRTSQQRFSSVNERLQLAMSSVELPPMLHARPRPPSEAPTPFSQEHAQPPVQMVRGRDSEAGIAGTQGEPRPFLQQYRQQQPPPGMQGESLVYFKGSYPAGFIVQAAAVLMSF